MSKAERFRRLTSIDDIRGDLRARSLRAAAFTWTVGVGDFILRLGSTAILARLIIPEHFGLVMMIIAVTTIADQFRDLGLSTVTVQRHEISHNEISNLFWINVTAGVIIALAVCTASPLIAAFYKEPRLLVPTCILATNFVWGGLIIQHEALLTRQLKLGCTSTVRFLSSFISTALAVVLAWKGFGYWALVWRESARCALLTAGMWASFPWIPGLPSRNADVSSLVRSGADLSLANIVASFSGGIDRLLLGRFWGAGSMAMYRQAYQLLVLPTEQLLGPVYHVTQPGLSMLQKQAIRFRKFYNKVLKVACLATMPLSVFVAVHSVEITRVVLGRKWADSAPVLLILSLSNFIKQPVGSTAFVLIAQGRSRLYLMLSLLQNGVAALCMCIGVRWGTAGIAMGEVAATYLLIAPRLYYTFKDSPFGVRSFFCTICRPAASSIVMGIVLTFVRQSLPPLDASAHIVIGGALGAIVFLGFWMLLPGGGGELLELISDVRSALQRTVSSKAIDPVPVATEPAVL